VLPEPFPANPYDPAEFALDAVLTAPDGSEQRVPGFAREPILLRDRGDREDAVPDGPTAFAVRFRARTPGTWQVRLEARWGAGRTVTSRLPDLTVAGAPWDGYARVDHEDPRFFSVGGAFHWPIGLNLNSAYDLRSRDRLATKLTPDRGTLAYLPRMERFAAAGGDLVEIWMSSWNLALEWRADWPGFAGIGRYNQANAERLDRILDEAWQLGMRVNLVINNHGQASPQADREWKDNPLNTANGGPLTDPYAVFTDPRALAYQERLRRYLVARYADHPAVFGWKLWSEVNLTAAGDLRRGGGNIPDAERRETLLRWHEAAAARWHALDGYGHGVTTHWAGDYRRPDRAIVALPGIDYICIDAYHGQNRRPAGALDGLLTAPNPGDLIVNLLWQSTQDAGNGLARFNKPLVVTEYGASSQGGPPPQMLAESASGDWAGLVSGHGAAPMLWWFEWVDQGEHWQPYRAIARFLQGEDLRGTQAHSVVLAATSAQGELWTRAWARPGRMLGYLADSQWACTGEGAALHPQASVQIGTQIAAGDCLVQWWNADSGEVLATETIAHPGGALVLAAPAFARHLAFKLIRNVVTSP
nr:hypothetical protein [Planctomycetota bacterium]